jgi:hypothetical protein
MKKKQNLFSANFISKNNILQLQLAFISNEAEQFFHLLIGNLCFFLTFLPF